MNTRAALYGSLHMISIASHAVTKVLEPVHLRLFIASEAIVWVCTRTELRSSWKARQRSSPPQICCSSKKSRGRGDTQVRSRGGVLFFLDLAGSSWGADRVARGSRLSRPRPWEQERVSALRMGKTACLASRLPSRKLSRSKNLSAVHFAIEISRERNPEVDDELMIGRGSHSR